MTDLRQRLIDAGLVQWNDTHGEYLLRRKRNNEEAADAALAVFVAYLREQAEWARPLGGIWDSVVAEWLNEQADDLEGVS